MLINPEIVFENSSFVIIDKPAGLLSVKARGCLACEKTAADFIREKYGQVYVVHRLDRQTSGLMIFARNSQAHREISSMFEQRKIEKKYLALVWGRLEKKRSVIDKRVKEFSSGRCAVDFDGKDSITEYFVKKEFEKVSLVCATAKTGRRHQIRVHFYSIGHPLVGDTLYGETCENKKYPRLMLRSFHLAFEFAKEKFSFTVSKDASFESVLSLFE